MGLWAMNCIVNPSTTLLNTDGTPLTFRQETVLWKMLGDICGENDMSKRV